MRKVSLSKFISKGQGSRLKENIKADNPLAGKWDANKKKKSLRLLMGCYAGVVKAEARRSDSSETSAKLLTEYSPHQEVGGERGMGKPSISLSPQRRGKSYGRSQYNIKRNQIAAREHQGEGRGKVGLVPELIEGVPRKETRYPQGIENTWAESVLFFDLGGTRMLKE